MEEMNPEIIENYDLMLVGLERMTTNQSLTTDMKSLSDEGDRLELESRIANRLNPNVVLSLLWDWSASEPFPLMAAVEVESCGNVPEMCTSYTFSATNFAVFRMVGTQPNLNEPWPEIFDWFKRRGNTFSSTIRRYYGDTNTGDIMIPVSGILRSQ
jgi:predicted transcriptional regulator YdeE